MNAVAGVFLYVSISPMDFQLENFKGDARIRRFLVFSPVGDSSRTCLFSTQYWSEFSSFAIFLFFPKIFFLLHVQWINFPWIFFFPFKGAYSGLALYDEILRTVDPELHTYLISKGMESDSYAMGPILSFGASNPPLEEVWIFGGIFTNVFFVGVKIVGFFICLWVTHECGLCGGSSRFIKRRFAKIRTVFFMIPSEKFRNFPIKK